MAKVLYVLWRVDEDEFILSLLDPEHATKTANQLIELCIQDEYKDHSEIARGHFVRAAIDPEDQNYVGYEMPMVFVAESTVVEFLPI